MARPIFVLGASASGAELMRLCLDSHPNISIGPETAIMRLVKAHRFVPYWRFGKRWWERLDLTEEELNQALRDFYGGFFERVTRREGKRRWGDMTPLHVWHLDEIVKVFDDAVFVAVVRHPGASIASLVEGSRFSVDLAKSTWLRMNQVLVHDGATMGDRLRLVRYEDLVCEPEPVLRELLEWLDEPWSPAVLEQRQTRVSKWTTALTEDDRESVRRRTENWARFFGYELDEPLPTESLVPETPPKRFLLTGDELAERRLAFAEELDLRRPAKPPHEGVFKPPPRRYATRGNEHGILGSARERLAIPVRRTAGRIRSRVRSLT